MKLRFKEGAIVKLTLDAYDGIREVTGKVVHIFKDEVEICLQQIVVMDKKHDEFNKMLNRIRDLPGTDFESITFDEQDMSCTVDSDRVIHIDRRLVRTWEYIKACEVISNGKVYRNKESHPNLSDVDDSKINYFGKDGYCKGRHYNY